MMPAVGSRRIALVTFTVVPACIESVLLPGEKLKSGRGIMSPAQVRWGFVNDHLECGADVAFEEMASAGGAIRGADDDVRVHHGLPVIVEGDVPEEREDFDLFDDRDRLVVARCEIKEGQRHIAEASDRCEGSR